MKSFRIDEQQELKINENHWSLFVNGKFKKEIPEYLYKYYSLNDKNIEAFKDGYFWLSCPHEFNDPFDCSNNLILELQRDNIHGVPMIIPNNNNMLGITCFSENELCPLMWGHYANGYNGFVLKFKSKIFLNLLGEEAYKLALNGVIYSDSPRAMSKKHPIADEYQTSVKLKHWSYEKEWRLIVWKTEANFRKLYFSKDSIFEILLGYKVFPGNGGEIGLFDKFDNLLKNSFKGVDLFIVGPDSKKLKLKKTLIKKSNFPNNV